MVYFDITIGGELAGRMTMELRSDIMPRACENFRALCTGELGKNREGKRKHYKGSSFFNITTDYMCQGGDWVLDDGTGGESIFGERNFPDENFILRHTGPGCLGYGNAGPDSNNSIFYFTFAETTWLDDKHVVFGYLMGNQSFEVLEKIHQVGTSSGLPKKPVVVAECGQIYI